MSIWENKQTTEIKAELKSKLRKRNISSESIPSLAAPRFVFVCGKKMEENGQYTMRDMTMKSLKKYQVSNSYGTYTKCVLCVVSEVLYAQDLAEDIFTFEEVLAEISHKIIIIAESPGTFCELGAFVMNEEFRKKLLIINEDNEEYKDSFITLGPIKLIKKEYVDNVIYHNGIERLEKSLEFTTKIRTIAKEPLKIEINIDEHKILLRSLIYEIANIIEIFQPIESFEIQMLYKELKGFSTYTISNSSRHKIRSFPDVLYLMEKMGIIRKQNGYFFLNTDISCYNVMFSLDRKEYNDLRLRYLNQIYRYQPERLV